ncbi:beta strand repeat-containing protein [Pseudomonas putida]
MTTRRPTSRYHRAMALEPRILLDAAATATAEKVVAATDTQAGVTASGVAATVTIKDTDGLQSVDLFNGVSVSADGSSQALTSLVVTVSGSGSNQALVIDGTTISLQAGSGETANNYYLYTTSVSGNTTTITLTLNASEANSPANVATLIDGIHYAALDNSVQSQTLTVTLASLSDTDNSTTLGISSTVTVSSDINVAPELTSKDVLEAAESISLDSLGGAHEVVYSSNGDYAYVAGDNGIAVYSVDSQGRLTLTQTLTGISDLGSVTEMAISSDGKSLYTVNGGSDIVQFSVASDGTLGYTAIYSSENGTITGNLALSSDGQYVYAGTEYNGLVVFSRDADTGALSVVARAPDDNSRNGIVTAAGGYVYVLYTTGDHALTVYRQNSDGTLTTVASALNGVFGYSAVDYVLASSSDGQYVFVGDPDNGTLQVYQLSGSSLTLLSTTSVSGIDSLALSSDNSQLYVAQADGTVSLYSVAGNGSLSLASTTSAGGSAVDIALSKDGLQLLVAGSSSVSRYTQVQTLDLGEPLAFASQVTLSDSNNDALVAGAGDYLGTRVTVSASVAGGSYGFSDGNGLTYSAGVISYNGSAIATLTRSSDGASMTLSFTASTSTVLANQVVHQLSYTQSNVSAGSQVTLSVTSSDGQLSSDTLLLTLRANSAPQVNSDAATGYSLGTATSETAYSYTLLADLFKDADGDSLSWSVSGLPDGLSFDASTRTISGSATQTGTFSVTVSVTDASGASAALVLSLSVEQIANRAPEAGSASATATSATVGSAYSATLDSALFSDADRVYGDHLTWQVSGLPDGLSFDAASLTISGTASALGSYTLNVTVTDASGASASREVTLRVISQAEADNHAPTLSVDASALSYTAEGGLSGFSSAVYSLELSSDGTTLLVVGNGTLGHTIAPSGNSTLYVYSRDTGTGALTLVQAITQSTTGASNTVDGLDSAASAVYSSDGSHVYLVGKSSSGSYVITTFNVAADGTLSTASTSTAVGSDQVKQLILADAGQALYAVSGSYLYAYSVDDNGALTLVGTYTNAATSYAVNVDSAGRVYVLSGTSVSIYTSSDNGSLSLAGTWSGLGLTTFSRAITVSDDGYVFVPTGTSASVITLKYDATSNTLTKVGSVSTGSQVWGTELSADGTTLYAGTNTGDLLVYSINGDGSLTYVQTVSSIGGRGYRIEVSADGSSIYAGGYFTAAGLGVIEVSDSVTLAYTEHGSVTLTGALALADADYDALADGAGNYNGASISVVRDGAANASDTYGFADGNGLTLANGMISLDGVAIATFSSAGGALTVTFSADVTTAVANQVLQQITYSNTSNNPGSSITLKVTVGDAYTSSNSLNITLAVTQVNDAPTLASTAATVTYSAGGNPIKLFDDTTVSTLETGQTITRLGLTVTGVSDGASESLSIAGVNVALSDASTASGSITAADGTAYSFSVSVSVTDGTATVSITSSGLPASVAASLVDSLGYADNATNATVGERSVTLTTLQDSGGTSNGGIDTASLSVSATVAVTLGNQAPTLTATATDATYVENANAVTLFSDVQLSTGESGQAISSLTLSVGGVMDGASESLTVDGTAIALVAGSGTTTHGYAYSVSVQGDTVTLTLSSSAGISTTTAAGLVTGIAYANSSDDPTAGSRSVTLSAVQDDGGTANDGTDSSALAITATLSVVPVNDAPLLAGNANSVSYSTSGTSAGLFTDVSVSTVEAEQSITTVTFTVSGVADGASETLTVDGTRISLVAGSGSTAQYHYSVSVSGDSVTLTLTSSAGISTSAAASLIGDASYSNLSNTQSAGTRSIGVSVQDSGGTADGGVDSSTLASRAEVTVVVNSTPVLSASPDDSTLTVADSLTGISGLGSIAGSALSADGGTVYVLDSSGTLAVLSRNSESGELLLIGTVASGLGSASEVVISADGSHVYALGNDGNSVAVFTTASNGGLVLQQTLAVEHVVSLAAASNGSALYVVDGNYSGLRVYSLTSDGQYQLSQSLAASTSSEPYLSSAVAVQAVGDYVFVVTDPASSSVANTLIVYQVGSDGSLGAVAWLRDGSADVVLGDAVGLTVSRDGSALYVASSSGVSVFAFDSAGNSLTYLGSISGLSGVDDVALASDGATLYLSSSDGSVARYKVDGGVLTLLQTLGSSDASALNGAAQVLAGSGGSVLVSGSGGVVSLSDGVSSEVIQGYTEGSSVQLASQLTLHDADYDALNDGAGDYNGATISISRSGGASSEDTYGFTASNGLSLSDGVIYQNGTAIARLVASDGSLTLTFIGSTSTTTANAVLAGISYRLASTDPTASVSLMLSASDAYAASASTTLVLNVTTVNDAPTLQATTTTQTWTQGSVATQVFSDAQVSTVEAGQAIASLTLTVSGASDGSSETLTVDGTVIALVNGSGSTSHGYLYNVTLVDGVATLTVNSSTGISSDATASLVNQLAYANSSADPTGGTRSVSLVAVQDNGGSANGGADSTTLTLTSQIDVLAINHAPSVNASGASLQWQASDGATGVFSGAQVSTGDSDQAISALTLTVSGVHDSAEALLIDGTRVLLQDGFQATSSNGVAISVRVTNGTASITMASSTGLSSSAAQSLINGIAYDNASATTSAGVRTISIIAVQDNGGTHQGGSDRSALNISAQVTVQASTSSSSAVQVPPTLPLPGLQGRGASDPQPGWSGPALNEPALNGSALASPAPLSRSEPSLWVNDELVASTRFSVSEQLLTATGLAGDAPTDTPSGDFVLQGRTLIAQLPAERSSVALPARLPDGSQAVRAQLASGLPLPQWVRFDPRTGRLHVDRAALARVGTLRLNLIGHDAQGVQTRTVVEVRSNNDTDSPPREAAPTLPAQLRQAAPSALLDSLAGLADPLQHPHA